MSIENKVCLLIKCQRGARKTRLSELSGSEILDSGTGFFMTDRFIITAQHVLGEDTLDSIFVVIDDILFPIAIEKQSAGYEDDIYLDYALISSARLREIVLKLRFTSLRKMRNFCVLGFQGISKEKLFRHAHSQMASST